MKKLFSIIMCVLMVMCFMPSMAFATSQNATECTGTCAHEAAITSGETTTHYDTLEEAIAAVSTGQTEATKITLLNNVDIAEVATRGTELNIDNGKKITIDMNGKNINLGKNNYILVANGSLELTGTGTIEETVPQTAAIAVVGGSADSVGANYSVLKIGQGVTVKGYTGVKVTYTGSDSSNAHAYGVDVTVDGTLIGVPMTEGGVTYSGAGIDVNGDIKDTTGSNLPQITLSSTSNVGADGPGVYAGGYAIWNLAGNVTGSEALSIKSGKFTITGGKYTATGTYHEPAISNTGSDLTGAAISITTDDSYAKNIDVTISGGEFTSANGNAFYEGIGVKSDGTTKGTTSTSTDVAISITNGEFNGASGKDAVKIDTASNKNVISGGEFSSDSTDYVNGTTAKEYRFSNGTFVLKDAAPANTSGYKWVWDSANGYYYESVIYGGGSGGGSSASKDSTSTSTEVDKTKAEEEAKIAAEITAIKGVDKQVFKAKSKKTKLNGKTAIKVTWTLPEGIDVDGFEVYRSTSKSSGYGTAPYFTTAKTSYTNNKDLKSGKTYYYKVRGYKMINGEKVYTGWSTKAYRTI